MDMKQKIHNINMKTTEDIHQLCATKHRIKYTLIAISINHYTCSKLNDNEYVELVFPVLIYGMLQIYFLYMLTYLKDMIQHHACTTGEMNRERM